MRQGQQLDSLNESYQKNGIMHFSVGVGLKLCFYILWHVIMGPMASQITSLMIASSTVHSGADHRKHQSSASLAFVRGIHRGTVNSPLKWPVTRKMFPIDNVIMNSLHPNKNSKFFNQMPADFCRTSDCNDVIFVLPRDVFCAKSQSHLS